MPKYHVDIRVNNSSGYEVEANSKEDAMVKAEELLIDEIESGMSTYVVSEPYE